MFTEHKAAYMAARKTWFETSRQNFERSYTLDGNMSRTVVAKIQVVLADNFGVTLGLTCNAQLQDLTAYELDQLSFLKFQLERYVDGHRAELPTEQDLRSWFRRDVQ